MNYLSTTGKLSQFTQLIWVMSLAFFSFSMPAQGAWDWDYTLPVNAQNYPRASNSDSRHSTVTDPKFDLNLGSLSGNLPFMKSDQFAGDTQIRVFVSVENSTDFFEPLTLDDEKVIEQGSLVDINATITPEPYHQVVDIVVVAALDGEEEMRWNKAFSNWIWYQKTPSPNVFSDTGWKPWYPDLSNPYIEAYGTRSGQARYSINVFTGQLPSEIEGIGPVKRVHLFVGYGLWVPSQGGFSYLVSQPVTLEISEVQLVPDDLIHRR